MSIYNNKYQEKWENRSSIRSRPRKVIDFLQPGYFFPEDKQPLLLNEEVIILGEETKKTILLQSFYKYLQDIINLEINLISSVCNKIIYNNLVVNYPEDIKLNTYTIIIDEYFHVYIAKDMMLQLAYEYPNLVELDYSISDAYSAVMLIKEKIEPKYHDIFEVLAVCIFETTLVRELVEFFQHDKVHPSIKYYINDHMNDEAKHYQFFSNLLSYTWFNLPADYQHNIGKYLGEFVKIYLNINSEKEFNTNLLSRILNDEKKSIKIIKDIYRGFEVTSEIPIVKNVINILTKIGLLKHPDVKQSFQNIGWII